MPVHSLKLCWVHVIWGTKNRFGFFSSTKLKMKCLEIIKEVCSENNIYLKTCYINPEHVHFLVDLSTDISISRMMQLIKGISSRRLNEEIQGKFEWARGYAAFSVSAGNVDGIVKYINSQREHHRKMSFKEEWEKYIGHYLETKEKYIPENIEVAEATELGSRGDS